MIRLSSVMKYTGKEAPRIYTAVTFQDGSSGGVTCFESRRPEFAHPQREPDLVHVREPGLRDWAEMNPVREHSRLPLAFDECLQNGFERDFSLSRARLSALELDPAFVKAIKHLNAGGGVLHALRFE